MSKKLQLSQVRNIGVAAHVDAGKTTLTERILYFTGASYKIGEVHEGQAHMDYMAEEQSHGITITSAVTKAPWQDHVLQIVDTPGHVDFTIEVERSMRVLDGCVLVLDGVRGVEPQTETVWRQRSHFNLPTIFFVNKMDRPGADYNAVLRSIAKRLKTEPVPVTVPLPDERAVIHLIDRTLIRFRGEQGESLDVRPCPEDLWVSVAEQREGLLLSVAEADDDLADQVLSGEEPERDAVIRALRRGTLTGILCPCYGGSALRNLGVQPVLDGVIDFLPAPLDRPPARAVRPDGSHEEVRLGETGPLVALVFKVQLWDGRRHVFARIYRSRLRPGDTVAFVAANGQVRKEHVARLFELDAGKKIRLDVALPGQIVLIAGLRYASTGDTLCTPGDLVSLEGIDTRRPVLSLAIEPGAGTDEDKLLEVLDKLQQEDPTLKVTEDPETGQRLLSGMGELHLQIVLERLEREFQLLVRSGRPAVAVRETIRRAATAEALYAPPPSPDPNKADLMAAVELSVEPLERGAGVRIDDCALIRPEGAEPLAEQRQAVLEGVRNALESGPLLGANLEDIAVRITGIELFGQGSTPEALTAASSRALRMAVDQAAPALLHPVMTVEVIVPDGNFGAVLGDLQSRRAMIRDTEAQGETVTIHCEVALEQLLGYTTDLRSQTQGRGQFSMQFERFDLV